MMNNKQQISYRLFSTLAVLSILIGSVVILNHNTLFQRVFAQQTNNSTVRQTPGKSPEDLVNSLMSPKSLMESVINQTRNTNATNFAAKQILSKVNGTNSTAAGMNGTNSTAAGMNGMNSTAAGMNGTKSTAAGMNGTKSTAAGMNGTNSTAAGMNGTKSTAAGMNGTKSTAAGMNGTKSTAAGMNSVIQKLQNTNATNFATHAIIGAIKR